MKCFLMAAVAFSSSLAMSAPTCWSIEAPRWGEQPAGCPELNRVCVEQGRVSLGLESMPGEVSFRDGDFTFVAVHPDTICPGDACLADVLEYASGDEALFMGSSSTVFSDVVDWVTLEPSTNMRCRYTTSEQMVPRAALGL